MIMYMARTHTYNAPAPACMHARTHTYATAHLEKKKLEYLPKFRVCVCVCERAHAHMRSQKVITSDVCMHVSRTACMKITVNACINE